MLPGLLWCFRMRLDSDLSAFSAAVVLISGGEATMARETRSRVSGWISMGMALCVALALTAVPVLPAHGQTSSFTDVDPNAFYAEDVEWLVNEGITTGVAPGLFGPELPVTRGQAVTFLFRYSGQPTGSPGHGFSDVKPTDYFNKAAEWAFLFGITSGVTSSLFAPGEPLTRGQMVTLLHRCVAVPGGSPDPGFVDVSPSAYYAAAVAWARQVGVTTGTTATTFSPDKTVTRGQIASFLKRLSDTRGSAPCVGAPPDPAIQPTVTGSAAPGMAEITIINAAPEALRFSMGGPTPTLEVLDHCPACQTYVSTPPADACTRAGVVSKAVAVDPGRYRVAFEPVSGNTKPLFADWLLGSGVAYEFCVIVSKA